MPAVAKAWDESVAGCAKEGATMFDKAKDPVDSVRIMIDGNWYDVTKYLPHHPGGQVLATFNGRDASDAFAAWHDDVIRARLPNFLVGRADNYEAAKQSEFQQDKLKLKELVRASGWYKTDWSVYVPTLLTPIILIILGAWATVSAESALGHTMAALIVALGWHQGAWLGHDIMHNSVWGRITSHYVGLLYGNALTGISSGWWKYTHNMHHAVVNEWDRDPDVTHMPLFAVTERMFLSHEARKLSSVEEKVLKVLIPLQHLLYLPVMLVARVNLYMQGIIMLLSGTVPTMPHQQVHFGTKLRVAEILSLCVFWAWYGSLLWYIGSHFGAWRVALYFAVGHLYMGVLHIQITLSHWERPMATVNERTEYDWFRTQPATGRNINPNAWNNWYFGGLNMQIEHHLFPRVPRHNLPKLIPHVRAFCLKWDIPYCTTGSLEAVSDVFLSLFDVSQHVNRYNEARAAHTEPRSKKAKALAG